MDMDTTVDQAGSVQVRLHQPQEPLNASWGHERVSIAHLTAGNAVYRDEEQKNQILLGHEVHQTIIFPNPDRSYTHERSGTCSSGGKIFRPADSDFQQ